MPHRAAARRGAFAGFLLHSLSLTLLWFQDAALRRTFLVWLDFPASLLYLGFAPRSLFVASLLLGGLQWAVIGAALAALARRASRSA
jgi:hypothetical protein